MSAIHQFLQSNYHTEAEVELRAGQISKWWYDRVVILLTSPTKQKITDTYFHNVDYYQRRIHTGASNWIKKQQIVRQDFPEYAIRVNIAKEIVSDFQGVKTMYPKANFSQKDVSIIRKKHRLTETFGSWQLDITKVDSYHYNHQIKDFELSGTSYELELEVLEKQYDLHSLTELIDLVFPKNWIYLATNELCPKKHIIQPKTLERKDLSTIRNDYTVTAKVDGERCMVIIHNKKVVLVNKSFMVLYMENYHNHDHYPDVSIVLDGEYYEQTFLAFDIFNHNEPNLFKRHYVINQLSLPHWIELKQFYTITKDTIQKAMKSNKQLDGLIFTPIDDINKGIYKWKPDITMDVKIERGKMITGKQTVINHHKFKFSGSFRLDPKIQSIPGVIYEMSYDHSKRIWKILRIRKDKTRTNAFLTIQSVLTAIDENIQVSELAVSELA
jgi:hypothetical protein